MNFIKRFWTRYKLRVQKARIEEQLREVLLDREALDSSGQHFAADALLPFITTATVELRAIDKQLENA
jgi:hypothetical protein